MAQPRIDKTRIICSNILIVVAHPETSQKNKTHQGTQRSILITNCRTRYFNTESSPNSSEHSQIVHRARIDPLSARHPEYQTGPSSTIFPSGGWMSIDLPVTTVLYLKRS